MRNIFLCPLAFVAIGFTLLFTPIVLADGVHAELPVTTIDVPERAEASTELFEAVIEVHSDHLLIFLADYATNKFVDDAELYIELGSFSETAAFDHDVLAYRLDNSEIVSALQAPGEHALVMLVITATDMDMLAFAVFRDAANHEHDHAHEDDHNHAPWGWLSLILIVALLSFFGGKLTRKRGQL
ncbi:hypothetical protein [Aliidiomarina sp.]|uniref:hypothetical protein n=1 Tax=Aliidiomarina sp. TaxID=1872439 RepID=UPI003A4D219C